MSEPTSRYSRTTIVIHWLTAAGVTLAVALGWRLADAGGTERASVLAWHMSAGVVILLMTVARIAIRLRGRQPVPVGSPFEQRAAAWVHGVFYAALVFVPLLGWFAVSASGGANDRLFGFLPLPLLAAATGNSALAGFAEGAHRILAYGVCVLVGLHVAAAVKHHLQHPATGLPRMLPGARRLHGWRAVGTMATLALLFTLGSGLADSFLPRPLRLVDGHQPATTMRIDPRKAPVFATIQPIFDQKCGSCHGDSSRKGGLRLDTFDSVMQGGEGGKVILAGKADESELVRRIMMPPSHKYAMPPAGKAPLTPAESQLLLWWIGAGADDSTTIQAANPPPLVQTILSDIGVSSESPALEREVAMPDPQTMQKLRESFQVRFVYRGRGFLQAQPRHEHGEDQSLQLDALASVADQLVWLDLSGSKLAGPQFSSLARLRGLQRLNLANTGADDAGVRELQDLPYLEVLNMYGTRVTDASLATLERMPSLMTVYLTGTAVTGEAVESLRTRHPGLKVVWTAAEPG